MAVSGQSGYLALKRLQKLPLRYGCSSGNKEDSHTVILRLNAAKPVGQRSDPVYNVMGYSGETIAIQPYTVK
jgi:hypothetical protein